MMAGWRRKLQASRKHSEMRQKYLIKGSTKPRLNKPTLNDGVGDFGAKTERDREG